MLSSVGLIRTRIARHLTMAAIAAASTVHPQYLLWAPVWEQLFHVYHGTGGFLDGAYLVAHPREWQDWDALEPKTPTKKLKARRQLARYENLAETLIDTKRSALFRESIVRQIGGQGREDSKHPIVKWWSNVDGVGTSIDDWMSEAFTVAANLGAALHVMDRPEVLEAPLTQADQPAPFLRLYSPLDMPDWIEDEQRRLTAVRLLEVVPRKSITKGFSPTDIRERVLDTTTWKIVREAGRPLRRARGGDHGFGRLPLVRHYAKKPSGGTIVGKSVLNDPKLYIDLYNLTSEIRELLREQTFGILNVQLGTGETAVSVEAALRMIGQEKGADNLLFTPGPANYIQPNASNVTVYQEERRQLIRTIYRLASVPWESDSKDAEAEGSLKLKREDMNQILAGYADECERAEYEIVELWFRAQYGEAWAQQLRDAEIVIRYPDTFDVTPFEQILEQAEAALTLDMGPTFMKELKRRLVAKFLPDATPEVLQAIVNELEEQAKRAADESGPAAIRRAREILLRAGAAPERLAA